MTLSQSLRWPILMVCLFWVIKLGEHALQIDLYQLGIFPLSLEGLPGIVFSPFLHGNFQHLASNTPTFIVLGASIYFFYPRIATKVITVIYIFSGIGVWLLARPDAYHIGASGLIYGFASFLFFSGVFRKEPKTLAISMVVLLLYGSMLYGIFPQQKGVSWESHLIGAVAGGNFAFYFRKENRKYKEDSRDDNIINESTEGYQNIENKSFKYYYRENE